MVESSFDEKITIPQNNLSASTSVCKDFRIEHVRQTRRRSRRTLPEDILAEEDHTINNMSMDTEEEIVDKSNQILNKSSNVKEITKGKQDAEMIATSRLNSRMRQLTKQNSVKDHHGNDKISMNDTKIHQIDLQECSMVDSCKKYDAPNQEEGSAQYSVSSNDEISRERLQFKTGLNNSFDVLDGSKGKELYRNENIADLTDSPELINDVIFTGTEKSEYVNKEVSRPPISERRSRSGRAYKASTVALEGGLFDESGLTYKQRSPSRAERSPSRSSQSSPRVKLNDASSPVYTGRKRGRPSGRNSRGRHSDSIIVKAEPEESVPFVKTETAEEILSFDIETNSSVWFENKTENDEDMHNSIDILPIETTDTLDLPMPDYQNSVSIFPTDDIKSPTNRFLTTSTSTEGQIIAPTSPSGKKIRI